MVLTIDQEKSKPYQGIVPLTGHSLNGALEHYFQQSEQLPTRLWLACNESSAVGLLLQKLPGTEEDSDSWNRITQLASTITDEELLGLEQTEILHRLFHEETIRLFEPDSLRFRCSCSREKISTMIHSLGKQQAQDILKQQGEINVHCEFCNARYDFDAIDVEQIFLPGNPLPTTKTTH
jgi:molecular chaperone Hsp33